MGSSEWESTCSDKPDFRQKDTIMLLKHQERVIAVLLALVVLGYFYAALAYKIGTVERPGAGFFPVMLSVLAGILTVVCLVIADRTTRVEGNRRTLIFVAGLVAFCVLLEPLGFVIMGTAFVWLSMRLLGGRGLIRGFLFSLATALIIYAAFAKGFGIFLPKGVLPWTL